MSEVTFTRRDEYAHARRELVALAEALTPSEGRTDTAYPGLAIYRFEDTTTCSKSAVPGATLVVVLRGDKVVRIAGQTLHADTSRHLVITRETDVEATSRAHEGSYLSLSLTFPTETIVKALVALADAGEPMTEETIPAFVSTSEACLSETLVRLLRTLDDPVDRRLVAPLVVEELALRLLRCDAAAAMRSAIGKNGDAIKIDRAMRFMRESSARALSVHQIARHVGMSASHFAHRFRDVARVSPMRYLRQLRLGEARALMLVEGARPSEVAVRVGFESASHFSREFKRQFGAAPAEYVRKMRV